jgi:hypothetical protein
MRLRNRAVNLHTSRKYDRADRDNQQATAPDEAHLPDAERSIPVHRPRVWPDSRRETDDETPKASSPKITASTRATMATATGQKSPVAAVCTPAFLRAVLAGYHRCDITRWAARPTHGHRHSWAATGGRTVSGRRAHRGSCARFGERCA